MCTAGAQVPNFVNAAWFQQDRERDSVALNLQLKPGEALEFNLSGLYIKEDFANYNQSMYNFLSLTADEVDELTVGAERHRHRRTFRARQPRVLRQQRARFRADDQGPGPAGCLLRRWLDAVGPSRPEQGRQRPSSSGSSSRPLPAASAGTSAGASRSTIRTRRAIRRTGAAEGFFGNHGIFKTEAEDTYAQADFSIEFDGMFNELRRGRAPATSTRRTFRSTSMASLAVGDLEQVGTIGLTDIQGFAPDHGQHVYAGRSNVLNWVTSAPPNFANPDAASFLNNTFNIEQTNTAAYAQLNFGKEQRLHGNFGVRFVKAEIESTAYDLGSDTPVLPARPEWLVTQKNDDDYVLPSLNLAFDATDDVVLRFAAAKVVAWAPYNQMAPNTFLNDTTLTGSGGNADLGPYESTNYNVSAEWYFASRVGVGGIGVLQGHRQLHRERGRHRTAVQFDQRRRRSRRQFLNARRHRGAAPLDGFCSYSILRPRNSGSGEIKGLNLSYQQPFGQTGFGILANYTYADGETAAGNDLPFQSENQYNISPYYEQGPLSARVTYGWRSEYLAGGFVAGAPPVSVDSYADLGLSLGWKFNETWQLNFDAQNLLDEEYFQYFEEKSQPANTLQDRAPLSGFATGEVLIT